MDMGVIEIKKYSTLSTAPIMEPADQVQFIPRKVKDYKIPSFFVFHGFSYRSEPINIYNSKVSHIYEYKPKVRKAQICQRGT